MEQLNKKEMLQLKPALREFYEEYAICLDEMELDRWPQFFTDDCLYQVMDRECHSEGLTHAVIYCKGVGMIKDRVTALQETTVYQPRALRHFVGGLRILSVEQNEVHAQANFVIFECMSDTEPKVLMVGRYFDHISQDQGCFRFRERLCVYDNYRVHTTLLMPV